MKKLAFQEIPVLNAGNSSRDYKAMLVKCGLSIVACAYLTACTQREIVPFNVKAAHPERFICEGLADRPTIPPEYLIEWSALLQRSIDGNWSHAQTIDAARNEHLAYVRSIRTREGKVAGYLVEIEGRHFQCASNLQWQSDYYDGLGD